MKHNVSRDLFAYWDKQRGVRLAPTRNDIDPGAIRGVLGDCFMLTREPGLEPTFRLAGTRICELFGRELKGAPFLSLWDVRSHAELGALLDQAAEETAGFVAGVTAEVDDGAPLALELLLLPLFGAGATEPRSIGTLASLTAANRPNLQTVSGLTLTGWRLVGPQIETTIVPRHVDLPPANPVRAGLRVHPGGRV